MGGRQSARRLRLRDGELRVFYRVESDRVLVDASGRKKDSQLVIGGRKVTL